MKKTNKYIREELRKDFKAGSVVISDALNNYFDSKRVYLAGTTFDRNYCIDGFTRIRGGNVYVNIYWQGDSTDGHDCLLLSDFNNHSTITIPAVSDFDGYRTRYTHDDIYVSRESVEEAMKILADILENKAKRKKD